VRTLGPKSLLFSLLVSTLTLAQTQTADVSVVVEKMTAAQRDARAKLRAYQAIRRYQIFKGDDQKTDVTAEVNYLPPQEKSFSIMRSTGGAGEGVIKRTLEHEVTAARSPHDYEISPSNYDFALLGEEPCSSSACYILAIKPKRKCKDLIDGRIWVDKVSFLVHKVEGELAKSPSWWVKKASVKVEYGNVEGMWLQMYYVADAKMRMIGDYRMISRDVDLRAAESVAAAPAPPRASLRRRLANTAVVGESGFFVPHK
jgi:hypothetical protein